MLWNRRVLRTYFSILTCLALFRFESSTADLLSDDATLHEVTVYLLADDTRVIRRTVKETTAERQETEACQRHLERAYQHVLTVAHGMLEQGAKDPTDDSTASVLNDAIHVITLCTTDRPDHREKLTTHKELPKALVSFLAFPVHASAAAECLWILSYNSRPNHEAFVHAGATDALVNILVDWGCSSVTSGRTTEKDACLLAKMWAAAALQNLSAAYCVKNNGYCKWSWKEKEWFPDPDAVTEDDLFNDDGYHILGMRHQFEIAYDPKPVRLRLIRNEKLLHVLEQIICANEEELGKTPLERTWPTRMQTTDAGLTPSVVGWAGIGLVRSLALSPGFYERLSDELLDCLCAHAVRSPDWLETVKAGDALYRLGFEDDICEPLYDVETCSDYEEWEDMEGYDCETIETERWCVEHGDSSDRDGVSAREACCACGGGTHVCLYGNCASS